MLPIIPLFGSFVVKKAAPKLIASALISPASWKMPVSAANVMAARLLIAKLAKWKLPANSMSAAQAKSFRALGLSSQITISRSFDTQGFFHPYIAYITSSDICLMFTQERSC